MEKKSLLLTYLLWFFGGIFGLHHFYLGRDYHALVWWMFAGGYFGVGLFRDLWRIPEYVKDANQDATYMEDLALKMRKYEKPQNSSARYCGQMLVADAFGYLVLAAIPYDLIPEYYIPTISAATVPFATAVGIYLIGNIGRHEGSFKQALIGAYLTFPLYYFMQTPVVISSLAASSWFSAYAKRWRRTPRPQKSLSQRLAFLFFCALVYLSLWSSWAYFNCTVNYQNEESVKCKDAAKHFFKSPIWKEFLSVIKTLWKSLITHGWREVWREIVDAFDPVGEANALKVLGLNATATQQEISSRYRKLSREWHPDKHKDPQLKQIAQEKFIEIQEAYAILSEIKSHRLAQNVRNPNSEDIQSHVN